MGVWHISGMGIYPGAVTVPLTYIYLLLKAASQGNEQAKKFFETSGEASQDRKGAPEALIIFTSGGVIKGKPDKNEQVQGEVKDEWFGTTKKDCVPKTTAKYLSKLLENLKSDNFSYFYSGEWIKYIHFIKVDYQNFNDCFPKIYTTINALREKEIWINMVGGANPINASLILSAGFNEANARTYYVFESNTSLLHPSIDKSNLSNPTTELLQSRISILPIFSLDIGKLARELNTKFLEREIINIKEVEKVIEQVGLPKQYMKKLEGGGWIIVENEAAREGEMLKHWNKMLERVKEYPSDYSSWKNWAKQEGIIYNLTLDGKLTKL